MNNINSSEFLHFNILTVMADVHMAWYIKIININWNGLKLYIF